MHVARCFIPAVLAVLVLGGAVQAPADTPPCLCDPHIYVLKPVTLTAAEQKAVSAHIKPCWGGKTGPFDTQNNGTAVPPSPEVPVELTVDADGTVRDASVVLYNRSSLSDAAYKSFAHLAYEAATNPRCATLPLPPVLLGQAETFTFQFSS